MEKEAVHIVLGMNEQRIQEKNKDHRFITNRRISEKDYILKGDRAK